ncbi:MAG: cytochrome c-type biogenesis protein [Hyphomicrobiaceae bacterium]
MSDIRVWSWLLLAALVLAFAVPPAQAVQPNEILDDPKLEQRARTLSAELRCLVCQNQSIDDSNAPLARDLRLLVRERLTAGDSDKAVLDYIVARYGEFVLLRPPFGLHTLLLWLAPLLLLMFGVFLVRRATLRTNRQTTSSKQPDLTDDEQKRLKALIDDPPSR